MSTRKITVYDDDTQSWGLIQGDALELLAKLPEHSIDAVICDPPYGISFAGQSWDGAAIRDAVAREKLSDGEAFERWTQAWAVEARRVLKPGGHLLAFGAPRTFHRLTAGVEDAGLPVRDVLLWLYGSGVPKSRRYPGGLGTALKPAYEPILLARAPLETTTTTANVERWGTGALNIDAGRVGAERYWPANVAFSHSPDCPAAMIDVEHQGGGRSRLFYCAKASTTEREAGCQALPRGVGALYTGKRASPRLRGNQHPTVKPLALMRWLIRLAVPEDGLVLDPFAGSGSTGIAAVLEGRRFLGIERERAYVDIACARLTHWAHKAEAA